MSQFPSFSEAAQLCESFPGIHSADRACLATEGQEYYEPSMTCRGRVENGVVVLEEGVHLAEGTRVRVEAEPGKTSERAADKLFLMHELAVDTGISDLASNLDHYLYGHPKK